MNEHALIKSLSEISDIVRLKGMTVDYDHSCARLSKVLKLKNSTELNQLMALMGQHVFLKNIFSEYLWASPLFAHTMGFAEEEDLIGKTDFDFPWDHAMGIFHQAADEQVLVSESPLHRKEHWILENGEDRVMSLCRYPVFDERGQLFGILGAGKEEFIPMALPQVTKSTAIKLMI